MTLVRVVTDSLTDIPSSIQQELGIISVPAIVSFGGESFRDKVDLSADEFYRRLASNPTLPTTSQPPPATFEEVYRGLATETDRIVSIHSTRVLTGVYDSAFAASKSIPETEIAVLDTQTVTMSAGWIVILAARAARQGAGLPEITRLVADAIPRSHVVAMLDTLVYAQRGGRLGRAKVLLGTLLSVKPILSMKNGEVEPVENVRTQKRALERLVDVVLASGPIAELAVMHAAGRVLAEDLRARFAARLDVSKIITSETGPAIGTHVGPNAVGACWLNT